MAVGVSGYPARAGGTSRPAGQLAAGWARYVRALREVGPATLEVTAAERWQIHVTHARALRDAGDHPGAEDCLRRGIAEAAALEAHAAVPHRDGTVLGCW